ncbi:hypothetical protein JOF28_002684 [Leucobacter exalbidus]|uniref:Uncharacterized protein n=1 Tax=Leucobacter exalbidus TaxID=662960 RepID=A0A940T4P6_9MICO|nr:hypothetical protein [Leucobacter exalbidus]MBP1327452.1 hypothetical protein [Leucobacter exalbidus]
MDLKFSFGGASPDHSDHGGAPSGRSLPLTPATSTSASDLVVVATRDASGIRAEVRTGAGVVYTSADVACADDQALPRAARSGIARAVAGLEGPLAEQVAAIELDLGDAAVAVVEFFGAEASAPVVTAALQSRIGVAAGTPIKITV